MFDLKLWKIVLKKIKLGPKFIMLQYKTNWPQPKIRYPNQVLVKNLLGGICGSDLHQLEVEVSYSSSILAAKKNPFPIGHEAIGIVQEIGQNVKTLKLGDRVVYNPVASCVAYGFEECSSCKAGNYSNCYCLAEVRTDDKINYVESDFGYGGGGFSEYLIGFEKQLHKIPDNIPDEIAILTEPYAISIHAVGRNKPRDKDTVIVYGAGIIGLLVIAAIRSFGSKCRIITLAKYQHQADAAMKLGSNEVLIEKDRSKLYQRIAEMTDGKLFKPTLGNKILFGNTGPDIIFDCIASEKTIDDSLHLVRSNGRVVAVGLGYTTTKKVDWAVQIYKEVIVAGTMMHGLEDYDGKKYNSFDLALLFMSKNPELYSDLVTHKFSIDDFKKAINLSFNKGKNKAVKIVLDYR